MKLIRWVRDRFLRRRIMAGGGHEATDTIVKALIPNSWFTKKGPGVEANARKAFEDMTPKQRMLAVNKKWIPMQWLVDIWSKR